MFIKIRGQQLSPGCPSPATNSSSTHLEEQNAPTSIDPNVFLMPTQRSRESLVSNFRKGR